MPGIVCAHNPWDSVIATENGAAAALEIVDEIASPADALFCMRA
jgi:hypothetical protein